MTSMRRSRRARKPVDYTYKLSNEPKTYEEAVIKKALANGDDVEEAVRRSTRKRARPKQEKTATTKKKKSDSKQAKKSRKKERRAVSQGRKKRTKTRRRSRSPEVVNADENENVHTASPAQPPSPPVEQEMPLEEPMPDMTALVAAVTQLPAEEPSIPQALLSASTQEPELQEVAAMLRELKEVESSATQVENDDAADLSLLKHCTSLTELSTRQAALMKALSAEQEAHDLTKQQLRDLRHKRKTAVHTVIREMREEMEDSRKASTEMMEHWKSECTRLRGELQSIRAVCPSPMTREKDGKELDRLRGKVAELELSLQKEKRANERAQKAAQRKQKASEKNLAQMERKHANLESQWDSYRLLTSAAITFPFKLKDGDVDYNKARCTVINRAQNRKIVFILDKTNDEMEYTPESIDVGDVSYPNYLTQVIQFAPEQTPLFFKTISECIWHVDE